MMPRRRCLPEQSLRTCCTNTASRDARPSTTGCFWPEPSIRARAGGVSATTTIRLRNEWSWNRSGAAQHRCSSVADLFLFQAAKVRPYLSFTDKTHVWWGIIQRKKTKYATDTLFILHNVWLGRGERRLDGNVQRYWQLSDLHDSV